MTRARAIGEEIAEQEKQSDIVNSADESSELIEWQKQLLEELRDMGFDDPDQSIDGGDAVEYLGKLYVDLKEMVES